MDGTPLVLSLKTAFCSTLLTFLIGIYAARWTMKLKRMQTVVDTVFTLPMVLPPTVVGFFLLQLLGKQSVVGEWLGKWGIQIVFSWTGTVIAAMVVAFPIMYRTARGAFEQVNPDWVDAARTLGLSEQKIFYRIILPNCWRGVLAGTLLSFARALGEFGATIMLAGNIPGKTQTLATAVYTAVQNGDRARAYEWVGIMVAISFSTIVLLQLIQGQQSQWLKKGGHKK